MMADALQLLFAAPNAETLLYPLVNSCNKTAASNQQPYGTSKAQKVGWTCYWLTCMAVLVKRCPGVLCSGLATTSKGLQGESSWT